MMIFSTLAVLTFLSILDPGLANGVVQPQQQSGGEVIQPWTGDGTVRSLHREYSNIFKHGNRNAASHLWSTFLLERSKFMDEERLQLMFSGFCAVSGSPVQPSDFKRYGLNMESVTGNRIFGYMYYCCWPCVCDTQDFIKVDTKNVTLAGGIERQYHFAVIGNPCDDESALHKPFFQPFHGGRDTTLFREAPEVRCNPDGTLRGATLSDHGYPIINMIFSPQQGPAVPTPPDAIEPPAASVLPGASAGGEAAAAEAVAESTLQVALPKPDEQPGRLLAHPDTGVQFHSEHEYASMCRNRAANGYNSGMGEIFRRAASIAPIHVRRDHHALPEAPTPPSAAAAVQVSVPPLPAAAAVGEEEEESAGAEAAGAAESAAAGNSTPTPSDRPTGMGTPQAPAQPAPVVTGVKSEL